MSCIFPMQNSLRFYFSSYQNPKLWCHKQILVLYYYQKEKKIAFPYLNKENLFKIVLFSDLKIHGWTKQTGPTSEAGQENQEGQAKALESP